jgi:hypothetical protein
MFDDLEMPCFYLRNQALIALFKIDENGSPMVELIPSLNMEKVIKESKSHSFTRPFKVKGIISSEPENSC